MTEPHRPEPEDNGLSLPPTVFPTASEPTQAFPSQLPSEPTQVFPPQVAARQQADPTLTINPKTRMAAPPVQRPRRTRWVLWVSLGLGVVALGTVLGLYLSGALPFPRQQEASDTETVAPEPMTAPRAPETAAPAASTPQVTDVPEPLRRHLEKAKAGDTHAMRFLGVCYLYGLDVPQNRAEGLKWYRRAAEAGDTTAQRELRSLEGKQEVR